MRHLLGFVRQGDVSTVIQLSNGVLSAVTPAVRTRKLPPEGMCHGDRALVRLLKRTINLEQLDIVHGNSSTGGQGLMDAIRDGSVGSKLQRLWLSAHGIAPVDPAIAIPWAHALTAALRAGRLPCLTELQLQGVDGYDGLALAEALEARRDRGLPPLTRVAGLGYINGESLHRIWACCPPDKVSFTSATLLASCISPHALPARIHTHTQSLPSQPSTFSVPDIKQVTYLKASGVGCLQVLGQYLRLHPDFGSLRSLVLDGKREYIMSDDDDDDDDETHLLLNIFVAFHQGRVPLLEELKIIRLVKDTKSLGLLAVVIDDAKLPALSQLMFNDVPSEGVLAVMRTLRESHVGLCGLRLCNVEFDEIEAQLLACMLGEGAGAFRWLEELTLVGMNEDWSPVVEALAHGAPCAETLGLLRLCGWKSVQSSTLEAFLRAVGGGGFPSLENLVLGKLGVGLEGMQQLEGALVEAVDKGAPSSLRVLDIYDDTLDISCLDALTPAFKAGALPRLTSLDLLSQKKRIANPNIAFPEAWVELGPKIKIEWLGLDMVLHDVWQPGSDSKSQILAALANPAFCPFLRGLTGFPSGTDGWKVKDAFNQRQAALRKGQPGSSTKPLAPVEAMVEVMGECGRLKEEVAALKGKNMELEEEVAELRKWKAEALAREGQQQEQEG